MKVAKLVSGILSIVLALLVMFQSCAAGIGNALEENGEVGGTGGLLVALLRPGCSYGLCDRGILCRPQHLGNRMPDFCCDLHHRRHQGQKACEGT